MPLRPRPVLLLGVVLGLLALSCKSNHRRCDELKRAIAARIEILAKGCIRSEECMPLAGTCRQPASILNGADTREVTHWMDVYEADCACPDGGAGPLPETLCINGICRTRADESGDGGCQAYQEKIRSELANLNTCSTDSDCATATILTCPALCRQPINARANTGTLSEAVRNYYEGNCAQCAPDCAAPTEQSCEAGRCLDTRRQISVNCDWLRSEMYKLSQRSTCSKYSDCDVISFMACLGACASPSNCTYGCNLAINTYLRGEGQLLALEARQANCDMPCREICTMVERSHARCFNNRCLMAQDCPVRLAGERNFQTTYRVKKNGQLQELLIKGDGTFVHQPSGTPGQFDIGVITRLSAYADEAAVFCLDNSFHNPQACCSEFEINLGFTLNGSQVALSWDGDDASRLPSGLQTLADHLNSMLDLVAP